MSSTNRPAHGSTPRGDVVRGPVESPMAFVYHLVPSDLRDDVIYPLNQLVSIHPDLYDTQRSKYVNREESLGFRIPYLGVLWNDAIHCAPIHPYFVWRARQSVGIVPASSLPMMAFKIPVDRILVHPVVWYRNQTFWINGAPGRRRPAHATRR